MKESAIFAVWYEKNSGFLHEIHVTKEWVDKVMKQRGYLISTFLAEFSTVLVF